MELVKPTVKIDAMVYHKIMHWVNKSEFEVSGLGTVIYDKSNKIFHVKSAMLLPQKNTKTHTEIDERSVQKAMFMLRDAPGELRFWWHSHVKMGVFWSQEDEDTIKEIGGQGWVLATVFNQKREWRSACLYTEGMLPSFMDELNTMLDLPADEVKTWDEDYETNVKNVKHEYPKTNFPLPTIVPSTTSLTTDTASMVNGGNGTEGAGGTIESWKANDLHLRLVGPTKVLWISENGHAWRVISDESARAGILRYHPKPKPVPSFDEKINRMTGTRYSRAELEQAIMNDDKPAGMRKKDWNALKKAWNQISKTPAIKAITTQTSDDMPHHFISFVNGKIITEADFVQPYPFTQEELNFFGKEGWEVEDLDYLITQGFTRGDIIKDFKVDLTDKEDFISGRSLQ